MANNTIGYWFKKVNKIASGAVESTKRATISISLMHFESLDKLETSISIHVHDADSIVWSGSINTYSNYKENSATFKYYVAAVEKVFNSDNV